MKSKILVGNILCGALSAFGIVAAVVSLLEGSSGIWRLNDCGQIILLVLTFLYTFIGYKIPHGNILKYIILIHGALYLLAIPALVQSGNTALVILIAIEIGLTCYIAGRLAKVKEDMILMAIVMVCPIIALISAGKSGILTIGSVVPLITWINICVAYFIRYREHREAGLMDAPELLRK